MSNLTTAEKLRAFIEHNLAPADCTDFEDINLMREAADKLEKLENLQPETLNTSEIVLVELKTPRGRLSGPQERVIKKLREQGAAVYVIDSVEGFEEVLERHSKSTEE